MFFIKRASCTVSNVVLLMVFCGVEIGMQWDRTCVNAAGNVQLEKRSLLGVVSKMESQMGKYYLNMGVLSKVHYAVGCVWMDTILMEVIFEVDNLSNQEMTRFEKPCISVVEIINIIVKANGPNSGGRSYSHQNKKKPAQSFNIKKLIATQVGVDHHRKFELSSHRLKETMLLESVNQIHLRIFSFRKVLEGLKRSQMIDKTELSQRTSMNMMMLLASCMKT